MIDSTRVSAIVADLRSALLKADNAFDMAILHPFDGEDHDEFDEQNAAWWIEILFLKLFAALEALSLNHLQQMALADFTSAKAAVEGFTQSARGPEEPYSVWLSRLRQYIAAVETLSEPQETYAITKDLTEILRATQYTLTDPKLFGSPPKNEDDVHRRIEGVLRCVFPDLKHKPSLSKSIKNFIPDTGLPSIRTLIEYKFLTRAADVPIIADQILADTLGYASPEWDTFIYVIYETRRFRPEVEWNKLIDSGRPTTTTSVIVISGEPPPEEKSPLSRTDSQSRADPPMASGSDGEESRAQ